MKSHYFKEEQPYTTEAFGECLGVGMSTALDLVKRMILAGVAKHYREEKPDDWQDEALHGEYISGEMNGKTLFKFVYVGIIEIDGHVIICFPKYIVIPTGEENILSKCTREKLQKTMRTVCSAIEHYKSEHTILSLAEDNLSQNCSDRIAIALRMIWDYFLYGLYSNQRNELTACGNGDIDWEHTINTSVPFIQENRPYYVDYYTNDIVQDETDYITRLHACIISECSACLKECELAEILQLDTPTPYVGERIDFGLDEYICHRLQKEINVQYITQKQNLLRNILAWVRQDGFSTNSSGIQLFGTNSFHTLWEKMCAKVFDSQYKTPISDLGIELKGDFSNKKDTLESLIGKPEWTPIGTKSIKKAGKTLIPDYVRVIRTADKRSFFVILDAKYYDVELTDKVLLGQPGVEDICKQYLYQIAYAPFIEAHNLKSANIFICPADGSESKLIGTASMPLFSWVTCKKSTPSEIRLFKLSAEKLMDCYIANKKLPLEEEFKDLFA